MGVPVVDDQRLVVAPWRSRCARRTTSRWIACPSGSRVRKKSSPVSPTARTRGCCASALDLRQRRRAAPSPSRAASLGCIATPATTRRPALRRLDRPAGAGKIAADLHDPGHPHRGGRSSASAGSARTSPRSTSRWQCVSTTGTGSGSGRLGQRHGPTLPHPDHEIAQRPRQLGTTGVWPGQRQGQRSSSTSLVQRVLRQPQRRGDLATAGFSCTPSATNASTRQRRLKIAFRGWRTRRPRGSPRPGPRRPPSRELRQRPPTDLLVRLGELPADRRRTFGAERRDHRRQGLRASGAAPRRTPSCAARRPVPSSRRAAFAGLARQEPLEAEAVDGQPGDGQRGEHRRRPGHRGDPDAARRSPRRPADTRGRTPTAFRRR